MQPALDIDHAALGQEFRAVLGLLAPHVHPVPLGLFLFLAALVLPHLVGRDAEIADGAIARRVLEFGVGPEISNQYDFVDAAHGILASSPLAALSLFFHFPSRGSITTSPGA